jgi:hypothetical protein
MRDVILYGGWGVVVFGILMLMHMLPPVVSEFAGLLRQAAARIVWRAGRALESAGHRWGGDA